MWIRWETRKSFPRSRRFSDIGKCLAPNSTAARPHFMLLSFIPILKNALRAYQRAGDVSENNGYSGLSVPMEVVLGISGRYHKFQQVMGRTYWSGEWNTVSIVEGRSEAQALQI